jgi:hypothetical protein
MSIQCNHSVTGFNHGPSISPITLSAKSIESSHCATSLGKAWVKQYNYFYVFLAVYSEYYQFPVK